MTNRLTAADVFAAAAAAKLMTTTIACRQL